MAYAKRDLFSQNLNDAAVLFKTLGHPARLSILKYLAETRVCITGDISGKVPLSRTTVNQHLAELKKSGLIQGTVNGAKVNYCLNPERIKELVTVATDFFGEVWPEGVCGCEKG